MDSTLNKPVSTSMLIRFALPTILSMLLLSIFGAIDAIMTARLISVEALAAVNLAFPYFTIILAVASMLAMGGSAFVARQNGEGRHREAKQNFTLIAAVGLITSVIIILTTNVFMEQLLTLLGVDYYMHDITLEYLRPISLMSPFMVLGIMLAQFMITDGKPTLGGITSSTAAIINTILTWVFITQFDMGIAGAAWATGIGYAVPSIIGVVYFSFFRKKEGIYFVMPKWDFYAIRKSSTNGISEFIAMVASSVVGITMNNRLMDLEGALAVAAVGIVMAVMTLLTSVYMGYSFGIAPIISYNFGAEEKDRLKKIHSISLKIVGAISIFAAIIGFIFASPLVRIYIDTSIPWNIPVYDMARDGLRIVSAGFLLMGFNLLVTAMYTAFNDGLISGTLSIFRTFVFILVSIVAFSYFWGVTGVWIAIVFAEVLAVIMSVFFFKKMKKKYKYA